MVEHLFSVIHALGSIFSTTRTKIINILTKLKHQSPLGALTGTYHLTASEAEARGKDHVSPGGQPERYLKPKGFLKMPDLTLSGCVVCCIQHGRAEYIPFPLLRALLRVDKGCFRKEGKYWAWAGD